MNRRLLNSILCLAMFLSSAIALFGAVPAPGQPGFMVPATGQTHTTSAVVMPPADFLHQVITVLRGMGGLSAVGKLSALIVLLIASTKVGALNDLVWSRLGKSQAWVAPFLGLAAGVAGLGTGGASVTPALVFIYLVAGGGAVFLHELLDSLKGVPGVGKVYKAAIEMADTALGGDKPRPTAGVESQDKGASSR